MFVFRIEGQSSVLAAATPADIFGSTAGIDVLYCDRVTFMVTNAGANNLTDLDVYWSLDGAGARFSLRDASINLVGGVLAPGASFMFEKTDLAHSRMRVTAESTLGTTLTVDVVALTRGPK